MAPPNFDRLPDAEGLPGAQMARSVQERDGTAVALVIRASQEVTH